MQKKSAVFAGMLAAFAAPASIFSATSYPRLKGTDLTRLRGDAQRVGVDFSTVIESENGKAKDDQSS